MTAGTALSFAEAAVARVCHDLSGPVGTMLNVLGLLEQGGETAAEAAQIALEAAAQLTARLRLAKLLWGQAGPASSREVSAMVLPPGGAGRFRLDVEDLADVRLEANESRLLACLTLCAAERLQGAGQIMLAGDPRREVLVRITGPKAQWGDLPLLVARPAAAADGADAHSAVARLLVLLVARHNARVSFLLESGASGGPAPLLLSLDAG